RDGAAARSGVVRRARDGRAADRRGRGAGARTAGADPRGPGPVALHPVGGSPPSPLPVGGGPPAPPLPDSPLDRRGKVTRRPSAASRSTRYIGPWSCASGSTSGKHSL